MFARLINVPKLYALAKRYSLVKKVGKITWSLLSKLWIVIGGIGKLKTVYPPVANFFDSSLKWAGETESSLSNAVLAEKLHDEQDLCQILPGTIEEKVHWKYLRDQNITFPGTYVLNIPNGRVALDGFVITPDNQLLGDVSKVIQDAKHVETYDQHPVINKTLSPARIIEGRVATITFPFAGTNYYHWMLDLLPRLNLIEMAGINLDDIDYFFVNDYISRFQRETLSFLGIEKDRIIESQWSPHIQANELVVPSLVGRTGEVPAWACTWLREKFWPETLARPHRRLYINRRKVSYRKVKNESQIEQYLESQGFESVAPENLSVLEQAKLFSEAEIIIAPHGAGLTNIVFCQPGTKIIELLHHSAVNSMYWTISNVANLDYNYILSSGERPDDGVDLYDNFVDISFNIDDLKVILNQLSVAT